MVHYWAELPGVVSNRKHPRSCKYKTLILSHHPTVPRCPLLRSEANREPETEETAAYLRCWQPWPAATSTLKATTWFYLLTSSSAASWPVLGWQNRENFSCFNLAISDRCVNAGKSQQNLSSQHFPKWRPMNLFLQGCSTWKVFQGQVMVKSWINQYQICLPMGFSEEN